MTVPLTAPMSRLLPLLFLLAPLLHGQILDPEVKRIRAEWKQLVETEEANLVEPLWKLAEWCKKRKLYRERDSIARHLILLDPDHRGARWALKYNRQGDKWVQSRNYRVPRSHASDANYEAYELQLAQVLDPFKTKLFVGLERNGRKLEAGAKEAVLRRLLVLTPNDLALRTVLGEVRFHDRWVLEETLRAKQNPRGIRVLVEEAFETVERPKGDEPRADEKSVPFRWHAARRTPGVRVLGTTLRKEVDQTAEVAQAAAHLFHKVFHHGQPHRKGYTIYLLNGPMERDQLLDTLGGITHDARGQLGQAGGGWLKSNRLAEWDLNPARRLDGAARQTIGALLMDAYGINGDHGWAWEGMGCYLVYHMTGTRLTYFFERSGYSSTRKTTLWPTMQVPEVEWLSMARNLYRDQGPPSLTFLLGREVNTMRDEDLLASYVLSAYLLEGRPDDTPRILRRIGAGEHPVLVFEEVTGLSMPDLEARLMRWLDEVLAE